MFWPIWTGFWRRFEKPWARAHPHPSLSLEGEGSGDGLYARLYRMTYLPGRQAGEQGGGGAPGPGGPPPPAPAYMGIGAGLPASVFAGAPPLSILDTGYISTI